MIAPSRDSRPLGHDADPIRQQDRLGDVVGDEHDGLAGLVPDIDQLALHASAGLRIERAERLVHQHDLRIAGQHAGDLHPLLHAARQLARILVLLTVEMDEVKVFARDRMPPLRGHPVHPQAERHVVDRAQPVEQRIVALKHHGAVDARTLDRPASERQLPVGGLQEARHQVQHRGLSASARAEQTEEFALGEAYRKAPQDRTGSTPLRTAYR